MTTPISVANRTMPKDLVDHDLVAEVVVPGILYQKRPAKDPKGQDVPGLFNAWVILDNPKQYNAYTLEMLKGMQLAFKKASNARDVACVVWTGAGDKAFSTGGSTKEFAEYYAGNPQEFRQYLAVFLDMLSAVLACDKPVINRVNGMRVGGGDEIGLAADFTITQDLARFGQSLPKFGSVPLGGLTDLLPLMMGAEQAMAVAVLGDMFSAHKAYRLGLAYDIVPALKVDGKFVPNPTVVIDRTYDAFGRVVYGEYKTGADYTAGQALIKRGTVDLTALDQRVDALCTTLMMTFPGALTKTIEEMRKAKIRAWNESKQGSRAWLAGNMMTEARAGFRAFNEGTKETGREIDFIALRQALAQGAPWTDELIESLMPWRRTS